MVTSGQIKKLFPNAKTALVTVIVDNWHEAEAIGLTKQRRIADFFAQIGTETGGLISVSESLNYSVEALLKKFGRHRISEADARRLGRKKGEAALSIERQRAIANILYGGEWGRKNLGNIQPNDGWDMRGGGMLQTTGRAGYTKMGFEKNPEALRDPLTAFRTALREWAARGCNARADRGDTKGNRKAINGGAMGLDDCLSFRARAMTIFPPDPRPVRVASLISTDVEYADVIEPADANPVDITGLGAPIEDEKTVRLVQEMLRNVGYTEVGTPNGAIGPFTKTAIRAFRAEQEPPLPAGDIIDDQLVAALVRAEPRKLPESRTDATPAQARNVAPELKDNWKNKVLAGLGAFFSGGVAIVNGVVEKVTDAKGWLDPVKEFIGDVPPWAWGLAVFGVAVVMFRFAARTDAVGIEAVKTGARR